MRQILAQCDQQQPKPAVSRTFFWEESSVKNTSGIKCQPGLKGDLVKFNEVLFPGCNPTI